MEAQKDWKNWFAPVACVAIVASLLILLDLGAKSQFGRAEIYFAEVAREMLLSGDWITPRFCEEVKFGKPPLVYWLVAGFFKLLGLSEAAARVPSALAGIGAVILTTVFTIRHYGRRAGVIAGLALVTSFGFWSFTRYAMSDALLTLFVAGALFAYREAIGSSSGWKLLVLSGHVSLALAVITKGPVAMVLVGLGMACAVPAFRSAPWRRLAYGPAVAAFFLISLPWYIVMSIEHGRYFLDYFLIGENVSRFLGQTYRTYKSAGFFLVVVLGQFFPWSLWLPHSIGILLRKSEPQSRRATSWWLVLWALTIVIFFSLSGYQLDYYILPAYPALAVLVGAGLARLEEEPGRRAWPGYLVILGTSMILAVLAFLFWKNSVALFPDRSFAFHAVIPATALAGTVALLGTLTRKRRLALPYLLAGTMAAIFILICQFLYKPYSQYETLPRFGRQIASMSFQKPIRLGAAFHLAGWHPDLRFYSGLPAQPLWDLPAVSHFLSDKGKALLIVSENKLEVVMDETARHYRVLDRGPNLGPGIPGLNFFRRKKVPETVLLIEVAGANCL